MDGIEPLFDIIHNGSPPSEFSNCGKARVSHSFIGKRLRLNMLEH